MELLNPRMTIQNAEGHHWLMSFEHDFNEHEHISLTVRVSKSDRPLIQVEKEAFERATEQLQLVSQRIEDR
jgi:hypothetical protein